MFFLLLTNTEEGFPILKIFLHDEAYTLCGKRVTGEITIAGLVVNVNTEVAIRCDEITKVKVSNKRCGGSVIISITELTINE